jgi:ribose-phosphate pyrophosphokinase
MDLHAPQIQGFFKKPVDHLYALPMLVSYIEKLGLDDLVVVAPDAGFVKSARKFASRLCLSVAIADKTRSCHDERAEIHEIIGEIAGKNAMIVDDFSISGGTLVELSRQLKAKGAKRIFASLSHLPLSEAGIKNIEDSDIEFVIVSRMQNRQSIGELMDRVPEGMLAKSIPPGIR